MKNRMFSSGTKCESWTNPTNSTNYEYESGEFYWFPFAYLSCDGIKFSSKKVRKVNLTFWQYVLGKIRLYWYKFKKWIGI